MKYEHKLYSKLWIEFFEFLSNFYLRAQIWSDIKYFVFLVCISFKVVKPKKIQLAAAVEYTNCISAEK